MTFGEFAIGAGVWILVMLMALKIASGNQRINEHHDHIIEEWIKNHTKKT